MKQISLFLIAFLVLNSQFVNADDPPEYTARFGGKIEKTNQNYLELVHEKDHAKIYVLPRDKSKLNDQKLSLSAIAHVNGKKYPLEVSIKNDHYSANLANSYLRKEKNFAVQIMITFPGVTETATFNLQNK